MCQFFSGIITKNNKKCLFLWESDSHETIKEENKLKDEKLPPDFVPVELTPPDGNLAEMDLSKWVFRTDLDTIPDWYDEDKARKLTEKALQEFIKEKFLVNAKVDTVENKNYKAVINSKIGTLRNSNVGVMWESSNVGEMWGSSKVGEMRESSNVGEMRNGATAVKYEDEWIVYTPARTVKTTSVGEKD